MKPSLEKSSQEVLAGLVERVTYHNAENGFCAIAPCFRHTIRKLKISNRPPKTNRTTPPSTR